MTSIQQSGFVILTRGFDSRIEQLVDMIGQLIDQRIERNGERVFLQVVCSQLATNTEQLGTYFTYSCHIDFHLYAQFITENIEQFYGRSRRTSAKIPNISIQNIHTVYNSHQRRCEAIPRCTMGMKIDRHFQSLFQFRHQRSDSRRIHQSGHIFESNHLCTQLFKTECFFHKIFIGKDRFRQFFTEQRLYSIHKRYGIMRIYRVTYGSIGNRPDSIYLFHRRFYIVQIVECIEYTHDTQPVCHGLAIKSVENRIGIRRIPEQITATRKCR